MLIIARRIGESFTIGDDIEVKIMNASHSRVVVAIAAPRALKIRRVNSGAGARSQDDAAEPEQRAANETIRQRRFKAAAR